MPGNVLDICRTLIAIVFLGRHYHHRVVVLTIALVIVIVIVMVVVVAVLQACFCDAYLQVREREAFASLPHKRAEPGWESKVLPMFGGEVNMEWAEKVQPPLTPAQAEAVGLPGYGNPNLVEDGAAAPPTKRKGARDKKAKTKTQSHLCGDRETPYPKRLC